MQHSEFVHLHVHSEYSLLDGAAQLEKLVARAKALRFPAIALTDHGNLFGAIDFYLAAQKAGVKPILGCELYVAPGSRKDRGSQDGGYEGANHLTVLVRDRAGYRNLVRLVSKAYLEGFYYKPRVDRELLAQHAEGLLVLSGCLNSEVSRLISAGDAARARETAGWYQEVFGRDHYFMEVQAHGLEEQARVTAATLEIARALGAPVVGTNDSHYLEAGHAHAHEALLCIQTGTTLGDPDRFRFSTQEFHVKSAEEMARVFAELPEACRNTLAVAERCNLTLDFGAFHLLLADEVGIARIGDDDAPQHLAHDYLDVLVIDLDALQPIDVLNFIDDVAGKLFHTLQPQNVMGIHWTIDNDFALIDNLPIMGHDVFVLRDQVLMNSTIQLGNHQTLLALGVLAERDRTRNLSQHAGILGRTGFEQLGNTGQAASDVTRLD